jgi:hypothetical protein
MNQSIFEPRRERLGYRKAILARLAGPAKKSHRPHGFLKRFHS